MDLLFLENKLHHYSSVADIPRQMIGVISDDRSSVVGRNNWCFIYEGSNNYRDAYVNNSLAQFGEQWARLIESRQSLCHQADIKFLQIIVPNKASLMPDNFPQDIGKGVTIALNKLIDCNSNANLLIPLEKWRSDYVRENIFRRNDSHLTVSGNAYLAELILLALDLDIREITKIDIMATYHVGDLGSKFNNPIAEKLYAPIWNQGLLNQNEVHNVLNIESGGFNGIQQRFESLNPQINKRILVFGNSFFERIPSWGVSPIFAKLFASMHFSWSDDLDWALIKEFQPDIVIAQTCERFLSRLPSSV